MVARESYRELVLENIGYDDLIQDSRIDRDIARGVFVPVSQLPTREPQKGVQTA